MEPRSWWQDDPQRMETERAAMAVAAPDLRWLPPEHEPSGGWQGAVPLWPFDRPKPAGLDRLTAGQRLTVNVRCGHAYPMVEPMIYPTNVTVPVKALGWTTWHVLPDEGLCLLQDAAMWDPAAMAAELIPKVSSWYLQFLLMDRGVLEAMTDAGIGEDPGLDALITETAAACE